MPGKRAGEPGLRRRAGQSPCPGIPEVPRPRGGGGGGGQAPRRLGRAEEVEAEVFPVPVSVRGAAAAAAAGAAMPKGGEGRARVARGPRGTARVPLPLLIQPAGVSESGVEGERPRRLRARFGPRRSVVRLEKLRTGVATSRSFVGLGRLGGLVSSSTRKAGSGARFSWLGGSGVSSRFKARGGLSHRVPRLCRARLPCA